MSTYETICFLGYELHPPWDEGTKVLSRELIRALQREAGVSVPVLSTARSTEERDPHVEYVSPSPVTTIAERRSIPGNSVDFLMMLRLARRLRRRIRRDDVDLVHAGFASHTVFSAVTALPPKTPFVAHLFGRLENKRLLRLLGTPHRVDAYTTCSGIDVTRLREFGVPADRIHRIPPAVEPIDGSERRGRRTLGVDDDAFVVGYFGHVKESRFPPAFAERLDRWAAAEGSEALVVTKQLSGRDFSGFTNLTTVVKSLSAAEKADVLAAADVWVFPFVFDDVDFAPVIDPPLSVLEAMAAGKPVVATRELSVPEYISEGETGCLHRPGDFEGLMNTIRTLESDSTRRAQLGQAARKTITETCSRQAMVDALDRAYRDALGVR